MREVVLKVYRYDELSDDAKEKAREWFRQDPSFDPDCAISDLNDACKALGIRLETKPVKLMNGDTRQEIGVSWSVGSYDDYATFSGFLSYSKGWRDKLKAYFGGECLATLEKVGKALQDAQKPRMYGLYGHFGPVSHRWHALHIELDHDTVYPSVKDHDAIDSALGGLQAWFLGLLQCEWEHINSDEYAEDCILANEYEFYENGEVA